MPKFKLPRGQVRALLVGLAVVACGLRAMGAEANSPVQNSALNGPLFQQLLIAEIEVREGDLLAFHNAGAYGFEMSSNFNSRLKPAEVMYKDGEFKLIRRADVFEDLLRNQVL